MLPAVYGAASGQQLLRPMDRPRHGVAVHPDDDLWTAIAAALVRWGRWHRAVMAAVAFRLLMDPAANRYYTVGLVLGLLMQRMYWY